MSIMFTIVYSVEYQPRLPVFNTGQPGTTMTLGSHYKMYLDPWEINNADKRNAIKSSVSHHGMVRF